MAEDTKEKEEMLKNRASLNFSEVHLTKDTTCGYGPFRGLLLQKFATKKYYILLYGCLGMWQSASWAYFNGTISTMEKRFKIPSRTTGLIETGGDISGFFTAIVLSYWIGNSHRPRWIAFGTITTVVMMWMTALPHFIYGPGEDALRLTVEYGAVDNMTVTPAGIERDRYLCKGGESCIEYVGSMAQPLLLFLGQLVGGIGGSLHYTLGVSYIDDNLKKSETPFFISLSFCIRMIGPTIGYALASACLKYYVAPTLTPVITTDDPRWIGAWWIGWLIISTIILLLTLPMSLFPKVLPQTAANKIINGEQAEMEMQHDVKPSIRDLIETIKRLFKNKIFFYNNLATVLYCLGENPYWVFLTKYIETQYRQTASAANFVTGTVGLGSTACGILASGFIISKFKPKARTLAAWNVSIGALTLFGIISYVFIDCDAKNSITTDWQEARQWNNNSGLCSADCGCEFVPYSPVCSENNISYISACHAGCQSQYLENSITKYSNCSCVNGSSGPGIATPGLCPVDCTKPFYAFLTIVSILKLAGAAGVASNFLVGVRCIEERDKSAAMGISLTFLSVFAFAPAPVLYGYLLDTTCLVWGKTCSGDGNCWIYNSESLAYVINITAAVFICLGTMFDSLVWFHSKTLKIFD